MENTVVKTKEVQLEIWAIPFDEDQMKWQEVLDLKQTVNNVRRGLFRRVHELQDKVMALEEEILYLRSKKT